MVSGRENKTSCVFFISAIGIPHQLQAANLKAVGSYVPYRSLCHIPVAFIPSTIWMVIRFPPDFSRQFHQSSVLIESVLLSILLQPFNFIQLYGKHMTDIIQPFPETGVATPMSWALGALLPGSARHPGRMGEQCSETKRPAHRIGVVPARASAVNGIRLDDFPLAPLRRLICYVQYGLSTGCSAESRPDFLLSVSFQIVHKLRIVHSSINNVIYKHGIAN